MNFNIDSSNNPESINHLPFFMPQTPSPQMLEEMMKRCGNGMSEFSLPFQWNMIPPMDFSNMRNFNMPPQVEQDNPGHHSFVGHPKSSDYYNERQELDTRSSGETGNRNHSMRLMKMEKRQYTKKSTEKIKRWTCEESKRYEDFIKKYNPIMQDTTTKRMTKVFLLMSQYIQTKNPSQCRSHHQKFYPKLKETLDRENNGKLQNPFEINQMKEEIKYLSNNYKRNSLRELNEQECIKQVNTMIMKRDISNRKKIPALKQDFLSFRLHKLSESQCEIIPLPSNQQVSIDEGSEVKIEYDPIAIEESTQERNRETSEPRSQSPSVQQEISNVEEISAYPSFPNPKGYDFEAMSGLPMGNMNSFHMQNMFPAPMFPFDHNNPDFNKNMKFQEEMIMKEQERFKEWMLQINGNPMNSMNQFHSHSS